MLYFVDESGIDLNKAPCSVLAGVAIGESKLWPFAQAFLTLKHDILRFSPDNEYEAKGNKLLTRRVFQQATVAPALSEGDRSIAIENLFSKNQNGEMRAFTKYKRQAKIAFVHAALDKARAFDVTTFASIVARDAPQQRDRDFLRKDFSYLFERLYCHVCEGPNHSQGVLILDEQDKALSRSLLDQMHRYFVGTSRGRTRAKRLIPLPFFVHSELTPAIQLADLVAYIANWGLRTPRMKEPARAELRPLADKVLELSYASKMRRKPTGPRLPRRTRKTGIVYIDDLRPRRERDDEPEEVRLRA